MSLAIVELPDGALYPSAKVRLVVRFEEFASPVLKDKAPKKSTPRLKGTKDERAPLKAVLDPEAPQGVSRFILVGSPPPKGAPAEQTASSDDLTHPVFGIVPSEAKWDLNGIRTADTLSLTIRWQDLPIDPRAVRSCAVEFFLGTVTSQAYAMGIAGATREGWVGDHAYVEPMLLVPDTYVDARGRARTNLRFTGWVDKWRVTMPEDSEATVELECVDHTRLLIKQLRPPKLMVAKDKAIDEAVATYLTHFPQLAGMTVEYRPFGVRTKESPPWLKSVLAGTAHVPNLGPPATGGGAAQGGEQANIWDYLTEVCGAIAHTIRVEGTTVIIQRRSSLANDGPERRGEDPYAARTVGDVDYPTRAMIYGRNLNKLAIERDLGRKSSKNIEMRSYDPHRKTVLVARFPEKGDQVVSASPGDGKADKEWDVKYAPPGIRDKATLKKIAEEYFNGAGRQELLVHAETKHFASFGGDNLDPDLLDMKAGDPFEVLLARAVAGEGTIAEIAREMSDAQAARARLEGLGFTAGFAAAYAKAVGNAGFQREFRLKEMSVDWNIDNGVAVDLTGNNYITARVDVPTTAAKQKPGAGPPGTPKGTPPKKTPASTGQPLVIAPGFEQIGTNPDGTPIIGKVKT